MSCLQKLMQSNDSNRTETTSRSLDYAICAGIRLAAFVYGHRMNESMMRYDAGGSKSPVQASRNPSGRPSSPTMLRPHSRGQPLYRSPASYELVTLSTQPSFLHRSEQQRSVPHASRRSRPKVDRGQYFERWMSRCQFEAESLFRTGG